MTLSLSEYYLHQMTDIFNSIFNILNQALSGIYSLMLR